MIIGFSGSGKSTPARQIAEKIGKNSKSLSAMQKIPENERKH